MKTKVGNMDEQGRARVLRAAAACNPSSHREAAIIGGIANSIVAERSWRPISAAVEAQRLCAWAAPIHRAIKELARSDAFPIASTQPVTTDELRNALEKFDAAYKAAA